MNAVEIEEAVSHLAEAPFDPEEFPYAFLEAFGNKSTTLKRLRSPKNSSNQSDLPGGVLQRNNIHIKVCAVGQVTATLQSLRESKATTKHNAKFILATDGQTLESENLADGETIVTPYPKFADNFGFFLALAGITTVKQIRENAFDIKATSRLNRLYVELLKDNPDWDTDDRREDMNHFMARLIFCFFAEDTNIFNRDNLFTDTVAQMSGGDGTNTHEVLAELFRAMAIHPNDRPSAGIRNWADQFPYVNGGLFAGGGEVPRFSKIARSYLLHVGNLDWKKINPDIFGSMIQAVADEEERGALGMHYTSFSNILKVLNPLFLDDLRTQLEAAGDNPRKLLNLRNRLAKIRVFDPACGSGNFLVIAYKEMRKIEAEINHRRGEPRRRSDIPLSNFRGIEIRHFAAEIARLALVIAKYQCDVDHLGQLEAAAIFLPLEKNNWITCGNALRLDWLALCPPTGTTAKIQREDRDLFSALEEEEATEIEFENEGGETYICGNPPYLGSQGQSQEKKSDLEGIFRGRIKSWKSLDYVAGWFMKAADYGKHTSLAFAFVATNSICQGKQVPILWQLILNEDHEIVFAYTSFKWTNLASYNAGVTVVVVGISNKPCNVKKLHSISEKGQIVLQETNQINAYLVASQNVYIEQRSQSMSSVARMTFGNQPIDGGNLGVTFAEKERILKSSVYSKKFVYRYLGSREFINGIERFCLWIPPESEREALANPIISEKVEKVREFRLSSNRKETVEQAQTPAQFVYRPHKECKITIIVPSASSEHRSVLPCGILPLNTIVSNLAFALYDAPLWNMALIASRLHLVWIATVCGKLKTDFRYSNTLGWNTFPVPTLTEQNKADMTRCAEEILLARERYFPATIADMYDPNRMDQEFPLVRQAHERNDEIIERIYIGRRFKNDTERLEKLFEMYTKMTSQKSALKTPKK